MIRGFIRLFILVMYSIGGVPAVICGLLGLFITVVYLFGELLLWISKALLSL